MEILNSDIRLATTDDKPIILNILTESFKSDPHINWLLENSNNSNKLHIIMNYLIDETFQKGQIYLSNNNLGVAMWQSEAKERLSLIFIKRNLQFLFQLGISTVIRSLKFTQISHNHFAHHPKYFYLLTIGVLPEGQGNGLASMLMNPVLEHCKNSNIPVFLETANPVNVEIYKKKGFVITDSIDTSKASIYFMKRSKLVVDL